MTATAGAAEYPISAATTHELERPLFGHLIDGQVVGSLEGGTVRVIDPATGAEVAMAAAGSSADVDRGQEEGAHLALGGGCVGDRDFFHQPTAYAGVCNDMRIAREEEFGPVLSVLRFEDEEEVYRWANETEYALAACAFTKDLARAHCAVRPLKAGTIWINTYRLTYPTVSYGGVKPSGHGRMLGEAHLEEVTQIKSVGMRVGAPLLPRAVS